MIEGIIGEKLGMTQIYLPNGEVAPITVVEAGPCKVVQKKTQASDGYDAVQISFREIKEKRVTKPVNGHYKKANVNPCRHLREFKGGMDTLNVGNEINVDIFKIGEMVDVTGISKGKGFAGVMKRHHFSGGPATHGSMFHREPGSIGSGSSHPSRVRKNKRLPGHMGAERVTVQGLEIVDIKKENNLLFIKGAIPGSPGGLLIIKRSVKG